jgi:hypothetical protein
VPGHAIIDPVTESPTTGAAERYRQILGEMADLAGERGHRSNERRWKRLVDELATARAELATSAEGRAAIEALMGDPRPTVRLWSAAAVLFWDEAQARPTLAAIREEPIRYDLLSITAKHTLLEYDAGRLSPSDALPGN